MHRPLLLVLFLVLAWVGFGNASPTRAEPELSLEMGEGDVDLAARTIAFKLGTPAHSAKIKVFSPQGALLHEDEQVYDQPAPPAPGEPLQVAWPALGDQHDNFRIELTFTDTKGNWVSAQVIRFYVEIPHEEVAFATGKWDIAAAEEEKLHKPLALLKDAADKYSELMNVGLYVGGHTDTVGRPADNQRLSEQRAKAIAQYFVAHGLKGMPIFVHGFGETALLVKTADNVPEAKNRRAQYIISSFPPPIEGSGSWQPLQ